MGKLNGIVIPVTPFEQNCTVLFDDTSRVGVLIDPGGEVDRILAAIAEADITVETIWLTHGHIDHAGGAMRAKEALNVDIVGPHEADRPLLEAIETQALRFGVPGQFQNCFPDRFLDEGEKLTFEDHVFEVFHCPGHAPGHVVYVNREAQFAHVGDVLFRGSIGRTDLPGGNHETLIASIKDKLLPLGDNINFICGHGPGSSFGEERRSNPFIT